MNTLLRNCNQLENLCYYAQYGSSINTTRKHIFIDQPGQNGRRKNIIGWKNQQWGDLCNSYTHTDFFRRGGVRRKECSRRKQERDSEWGLKRHDKGTLFTREPNLRNHLSTDKNWMKRAINKIKSSINIINPPLIH